ncbi:MAG: hypothetical protein ACR2NB_05740, partial [Solirubrobacteraceae bacterium]
MAKRLDHGRSGAQAVTAEPVIGVIPRAEIDARPRLFAALSRGLGLRFSGRDAAEPTGLDGGLFWGQS